MKHLSPPTTAPMNESDSVETIRAQVQKKAGVSIDADTVMDSFRESSFRENSALHAENARLRAAMAEMQQGNEEKSDMRGSWDRVEKNVQNVMDGWYENADNQITERKTKLMAPFTALIVSADQEILYEIFFYCAN